MRVERPVKTAMFVCSGGSGALEGLNCQEILCNEVSEQISSGVWCC